MKVWLIRGVDQSTLAVRVCHALKSAVCSDQSIFQFAIATLIANDLCNWVVVTNKKGPGTVSLNESRVQYRIALWVLHRGTASLRRSCETSTVRVKMRAHVRCRLEIIEHMIQNSGTRDEEKGEVPWTAVGARVIQVLEATRFLCKYSSWRGLLPNRYLRECSVSARWVRHLTGWLVVDAWEMVAGAVLPAILQRMGPHLLLLLVVPRLQT